MTKYTERMEERLQRYFEGGMTADEKAGIKAWIDASPENKEMAGQIGRLNVAMDTMEVLPTIDTEAALEKVRKKMTGIKRKLWVRRLQKAAAILFLPAAACALYLQFRSAPKTTAQLLEVQTHPGTHTSLTLPDGTAVWLNAGSSLKYPSEFTGRTRQVSLDGEAYFEVAAQADRRFVVSTPYDGRIEVLGTHFNVEAYSGDRRLTTTLLEGRVRFSAGTRNLYLYPRQKVIYEAGTEKMQVVRTEGQCETAWKDDLILFKNTPLEEGLKMLGKRFNVEFVLRDPRLRQEAFTGTFKSQSLERILEYFHLSSGISWKYVPSDRAEDEKSRIEIY